MRLFTALDVPEKISSQVSAFQESPLDARWTPPSQYHITLRFIGDVDPDTASLYEDVLANLEVPPVTCRPYGLDALPSRHNPSVLIVGLERTDSLMTLHQAVSNALEEEGLAPEDRTYRPHLTIARLNDVSAERVHVFLDTHEDFTLDSFEVDTFHLYESTLTPEGAVHERRASYSLTRQP